MQRGGKVSQKHFPVKWALQIWMFFWPWWDKHKSIELWKDLSLRLMFKSFLRLSQVLFPSCWPWPWLLIYISIQKLTSQIGGLNLKNVLHTMSLGLPISCKACLLFLKFLVLWFLYYRALLDFIINGKTHGEAS